MARDSRKKLDNAAAKVAGASKPHKQVSKQSGRTNKATTATSSAKPKLLSGGNPQIAKAYGDAPVQAYIAAMSGGGAGWKRDIGQKLDAIITSTIPGVRKAVKYNSPLYGAADDEGAWFLGIHCFAKYIKVAFFRGASLRPLPPGESKQKDVRYLDIYEGTWGSQADEKQFASWVKQATKLPGERM